MKKEYIVELREEEADELMDEHWVGELVRCKDCIHRGNAKKCIVAFVAKEQDFPVFSFDNRGYWFCADGKRRNDND